MNLTGTAYMSTLTQEDKLDRVSLVIIEAWNYNANQAWELLNDAELKGLTNLEIDNCCIIHRDMRDNNHLQITINLIIWKD